MIPFAKWFLMAMLGLMVLPEPLVLAQGKVLEPIENQGWFDAESNSVQPLVGKKPKQPTKPYDWEWTFNNNRRVNWSGAWFWVVGQYVIWTLLGAFFVFCLVWIISWMLKNGMGEGADTVYEERFLADPDRIELLPFQVDKQKLDLLGEANNCYEQGDYSQAIIYLYSYMLMRLDQGRLIRLSKGKTNRQYLNELRQRSELKNMLGTTMRRFEDVFFGHHALNRTQFEQAWQQMDQFHSLVQQGTPSN